MRSEEIVERISNLKRSQGKVFSNCFIQFNRQSERDWEVLASQSSLCIIEKDHGVNRIWFYTGNFDDLKGLLQGGLDGKEEYILDVVTKENQMYKKEIEQIGFCEFSKMMRMSTSDISPVLNQNSLLMKYYNSAIGTKADLSDADEINRKLWEIFDTRISHLQTLEELKTSIRVGEIYIQKDNDSKVSAILQRKAEPRRFYINQVYNGSQKEVIHAILLNELKKYNDNGGKYVCAWVEEGNIASCKFHGKYGLAHDGLWDVIYRRERIC